MFEALTGTGNRLLLPRILYGDGFETHSNWEKVFKVSWQAGTWPADDELEMVAFKDLPSPLSIRLVSTLNKHCAGTVQWWLNWVAAVRPKGRKDEVIDKWRGMILSGIDRLWFAFGVLGAELYDLPSLNNEIPAKNIVDSQSMRGFYQPLLCHFVRTLPEIIDASPHFTAGDVPASAYEPIANCVCLWRLIQLCGFDLDVWADEESTPTRSWLDRLRDLYDGDVVRMLLSNKVIRWEDGRLAPNLSSSQ